MGWDEEVVVSGAPHRIIVRQISDTEFVSSPPPVLGVSRTMNYWFERRDLIPPVPVKYPYPPADNEDRERRRIKKMHKAHQPPMPPKLPPELDPNCDTYEF